MTSVVRPERSARPDPTTGRRAAGARRPVALVAAVFVGLALWRAGNPLGEFNRGGTGQVGAFVGGALRPRLDADFVRLAIDEAFVTLAYAVLGTATAVAIGVVCGPWTSGRWWRRADGTRTPLWRLARLAGVGPRAVHEVVWALLLLNVLGLDPLVAVLAIAVPFGAITAQVVAGFVDEADAPGFEALRAQGAGRTAAALHSIVPAVRADVVSYAFYRFECAIRSAAILGVIGAGGLGFQLRLSFTSLRWDEVWTFLYALIALSGLADAWSSWVRRGERRSRQDMARRSRVSLALLATAVPAAWWWIELDVTTLWSARAREQVAFVAERLWPPSLRDGWTPLVDGALDTLTVSVLAMAGAVAFGTVVAAIAAGLTSAAPTRPAGRVTRVAARAVLLVTRAVPPPVWAIVVLFVVFPGPWPGAIALGIYNVGVVGRLYTEVLENAATSTRAALVAAGARPVAATAYATVPAAGGRLVALGLYRWEVAIRETVVVGVVGAGGLGRMLDEELSAFAWSKVTGIIAALVVVTVAVDSLSAWARRR